MEETCICTYESTGSGFSSMIVLTRALEDEMMECYKRVEGWKEGADGGDFYLYEFLRYMYPVR